MPTDEQPDLKPYMAFPLWAVNRTSRSDLAHYYDGTRGNFSGRERACGAFSVDAADMLIPDGSTPRCKWCEKIAALDRRRLSKDELEARKLSILCGKYGEAADAD